MANELPSAGVNGEGIPGPTMQLFSEVGYYGSLIAGSLYVACGAMLLIYLFNKFARKFIYPHIKNKRFGRVFFGTLYVLVMVLMALLILDKFGIPIRGIAHLSIAGVIIGSVVVFIMVPVLPSFPFHIGNLVKIDDIFGEITSLDIFRITVNRFDGNITTMPTSTVLASSKITNYSATPNRRIEFLLSFDIKSDLDLARELFIQVFDNDQRVLQKPNPPLTHVVDSDGARVNIAAYCWVNNEDWPSTRTDLWLKLVKAFKDNDRVSFPLPMQQIIIQQESKS